MKLLVSVLACRLIPVPDDDPVLMEFADTFEDLGAALLQYPVYLDGIAAKYTDGGRKATKLVTDFKKAFPLHFQGMS